MNILLQLAALLCPIFMAAAFLLLFSLLNARRRAQRLAIQLATLTAQSEAQARDSEEAKSLKEQNRTFLEQKSIAETKLQEMEKKLQAALVDRDAFLKQKDEALAHYALAEKNLALVKQHSDDVETRMQDWELQRSESLKAAKASILEAGGQLSSKLLEDHKREAEAAKKEAEEAAKKNAATLLEQMQTITHSVAALKEQTSQNKDKMSTVWRALTTPAGVGQIAEIGLENSLKNLGLEPQRDFIMQYHVGSEAGNLRPDAVIFLPQDMVMVIDSKASKFLLDLVEAEQGGIPEDDLLQGLARTMNDHLNALTSKNYAAAIRGAYKEAGRSAEITATLSVMYVPSENTMTYLKRADAAFMEKAEKKGIIIATPSSLSGLLSLARYNIGLMRQSENHDRIITQTQQLMDTVITMLGHAEKVGKGLKTAVSSFDSFAKSANRNVLPKLRKMKTLGVKPEKNAEIPARIVGFADDMQIEGEVETLSEATVIEDFSKKKLSA
jgi:DNA recombination protein RmuC